MHDLTPAPLPTHAVPERKPQALPHWALAILLVGAWLLAGFLALATWSDMCAPLMGWHSAGGPPSMDELQELGQTYAASLVLALAVPIVATVVSLRRRATAAALVWLGIGLLPVMAIGPHLVQVINASSIRQPGAYCISPGHTG